LISQLEYFRSLLEIRSTQERRECKSIAVVSGKGGVGKSHVALNLACLLGRQKHRVLLLDGDAGMADLNILLGITPEYHWGHFLDGKVDLPGVIAHNVHGFDFIHGFSGITHTNWLQSGAMQSVITALAELSKDYDYQIIDVGAGISESSLGFSTTVDLVLLVLTDELTSLTDAYGMLKTIKKWNPYQDVQIVINQVNDPRKALAVYNHLVKISMQFLGIEPAYLGGLPVEPMMRKMMAQQIPLAIAAPECAFIGNLNAIAENLKGTLKNRPKEPVREEAK
jgi:flagellar biosynthesis protein FlhG